MFLRYGTFESVSYTHLSARIYACTCYGVFEEKHIVLGLFYGCEMCIRDRRLFTKSTSRNVSEKKHRTLVRIHDMCDESDNYDVMNVANPDN